jgi:hypothetical protein
MKRARKEKLKSLTSMEDLMADLKADLKVND